jgi:hypothetical protein
MYIASRLNTLTIGRGKVFERNVRHSSLIATSIA